MPPAWRQREKAASFVCMTVCFPGKFICPLPWLPLILVATSNLDCLGRLQGRPNHSELHAMLSDTGTAAQDVYLHCYLPSSLLLSAGWTHLYCAHKNNTWHIIISR